MANYSSDEEIVPAPLPPAQTDQAASSVGSTSTHSEQSGGQEYTVPQASPQPAPSAATARSSIDPGLIPEIPDHVVEFLDGMLIDADMADLPDDQKILMIKQLFQQLDRQLAAVLARELGEDHSDAFIQMNNDGASPEQIDTFLREKIPELDTKMAEAFAIFRNTYVNATKLADAEPSA